jgi:hypothetical protein
MIFLVTYFKDNRLVQCEQVEGLSQAKHLAKDLQFKDATRAEVRELGRRIALYYKDPKPSDQTH